MKPDFYVELETTLRENRVAWQRRLQAIQADRRHANGPLDSDLEDQAIQRENDETLDALDERGRQELAEIDGALRRLAAGTIGTCDECGEAIPPERLLASPTTSRCLPCASESGTP